MLMTTSRSAILEKLNESVTMPFKEDTPLEEVLKYVKQATTTAAYPGIPIYVDPIGLQEAEKSMTSTVRDIDLDRCPAQGQPEATAQPARPHLQGQGWVVDDYLELFGGRGQRHRGGWT